MHANIFLYLYTLFTFGLFLPLIKHLLKLLVYPGVRVCHAFIYVLGFFFLDYENEYGLLCLPFHCCIYLDNYAFLKKKFVLIVLQCSFYDNLHVNILVSLPSIAISNNLNHTLQKSKCDQIEELKEEIKQLKKERDLLIEQQKKARQKTKR